MNWIKTNAGHLIGVAFSIVAVIVVHSWLSEHDARLAAEATIKAAQAQVDSLKAQQAATASAAAVQVSTLQKQAKAVATPSAAIAALPTIAPEIHSEAIPLPDAPPLADASLKVAVDAVPLYQDLNACKQCSVNLGAATTELALEKQVSAEKDTEIKALKAKPSFWHRVKSTAEVVGIGVAIGYAARR